MTTAATPTAYCLYRDHMVPEGDMSDEHIWPDALGGDPLEPFWRTRACARCNGSSGVYVDGAFIKSWIGMAERAIDSDHYLSHHEPLTTPIPFNYMGSLLGEAAEGETIDYWVQQCGAHVFHFRPENSDDLFDRYAGGDPRKGSKRKSAGRAYLLTSSPVPFWQAVAVGSFNRQFRKADHYAMTVLDPSLAGEIATADPTDPQQRADMLLVQELMARDKLKVSMLVDRSLGGRFQAKLGLALGYALFGNDFGKTAYCATLRATFHEADPARLRTSKVRGTGILSDASLGGTENVLRRLGGWTLWLRRQKGEVLLTVISPSARPFTVVVCDDAKLTATLDPKYDEGLVWITVPAIDQAAGPIWMPDYAAHQLGNHSIAELAALAAHRTNPAQLPDCGF